MNTRGTEPGQPQIAGLGPAGSASAAVRRALEAVAGAARVLVYDLSREDVPDRVTRTGITLRGSQRWQAYLERRRTFDDGYLSLVLSLRRLERSERLLAVNWGTAHANTLLLIEPLETDVDLSDADNLAARELRRAAEPATGGPDGPRLEALLRQIYGYWVYWPAAPATEDGWQRLELALSDPPATLSQQLEQALQRVFPPRAFDEQLSRLFRYESELFTGRSVERARSPFLTRLGLPAVYAPPVVTAAIRRMVNAGQLSAYMAGGKGSFQGPAEPVPDEVPDELFERMLL
jgi:hypothetical protein